MIYFDTEKNAYGDMATLEKYGTDFLCECTEEDFDKYQRKELIFVNNVLVENPQYSEVVKAERKALFDSQFISIPSINGVFKGGGYRKKPKKYSSAIESLNTCYNTVNALNKLPANTLIFYTIPDFADETQCTEKWLIENQFKNEEMTKEDFDKLYLTIVQIWNTTEHQKR